MSIREHTSAYRGCAKSGTLAPRVRPSKTLLLERYLHSSAYVSIRQHTSAYVSIRQHTSVKRHLGAEVAAEQDVVARQILVHNRIGRLGVQEVRQHTSAYVSIRQHTSAYVSKRQHTSRHLGVQEVHADRDVKEYLDNLQYFMRP